VEQAQLGSLWQIDSSALAHSLQLCLLALAQVLGLHGLGLPRALRWRFVPVRWCDCFSWLFSCWPDFGRTLWRAQLASAACAWELQNRPPQLCRAEQRAPCHLLFAASHLQLPPVRCTQNAFSFLAVRLPLHGIRIQPARTAIYCTQQSTRRGIESSITQAVTRFYLCVHLAWGRGLAW
jgi:hypothetical protein